MWLASWWGADPMAVLPLRNLTTIINHLKIINNETTNVYVLSDTTMKCGFLNDYNIVRSNAENNYYLFDEADTILNPLVSELNYPISEQQLLLHLNDYFIPLYK